MSDDDHGAHHDRSCVCWKRRECGCYLWDRDCPAYVPPALEARTDDAAPEVDLEWFLVDHPFQFFLGAPGPRRVGPGYEKALDLARDAVRSPHLQHPSDALLAECRDAAAALVKIAHEEGHPGFLADALRAMLLDTARRTQEAP